MPRIPFVTMIASLILGLGPELLRAQEPVTPTGGVEPLAYLDKLPPLVDLWGDMPFAEVASISNDPVDPLPAVPTGGWLDRDDGDVARTLAERTFPAGGPPTLMFSEIRHVGGAALARGDRSTSVLGHRDMQFVFHALGVPMGPVEPDAIRIDHEKLLELQAGESVAPGSDQLDSLDFPINPERVAPVLRRLISPTRKPPSPPSKAIR